MAAHFEIPEEAENALYSADRALAMLELLAAAQGAQQIEAKGEELSAMLSLIRQQVRAALDAARFRSS